MTTQAPITTPDAPQGFTGKHNPIYGNPEYKRWDDPTFTYEDLTQEEKNLITTVSDLLEEDGIAPRSRDEEARQIRRVMQEGLFTEDYDNPLQPTAQVIWDKHKPASGPSRWL